MYTIIDEKGFQFFGTPLYVIDKKVFSFFGFFY